MSIKLNFNELPKGPEPIKEGIYLLKIKDVIATDTKSGKDAFVFEYEMLGTTTKIKDYVMINNEDGTPHNFGRKKLRSLIEAAEIEIFDITIKALKQLAVGKIFKANLKNNKNDYPEVNYDDFYNAADEKFKALNEDVELPTVSESVKVKVDEVTPHDFSDEDI